MVPLDKNFSYHFVQGECSNKASWMYHRIFEDKRDIDIVFSGASHTGCAIMDEYISKELGKKSGTEVNVVNYGYCRGGRDIQYVMLKDLFSKKHPKVLVIDVSEDEPKKSHPVFPYLAESKDLFGSFVLFNQRYFSAIWKGIVVRFESLKTKIWYGKVSLPTDLYSEYAYLSSSEVVSDKDLEQNRKAWKKRLSKNKLPLLRQLELNYSKHYLEKIVRLASDNNCKVLFLYLPESGSHLGQPLLMQYYRQYGDVIILPENIVQNKSNWKDAGHFNDTGARETSGYIVSCLNKLLN